MENVATPCALKFAISVEPAVNVPGPVATEIVAVPVPPWLSDFHRRPLPGRRRCLTGEPAVAVVGGKVVKATWVAAPILTVTDPVVAEASPLLETVNV